jgi:hypothetical protein
MTTILEKFRPMTCPGKHPKRQPNPIAAAPNQTFPATPEHFEHV